MIIKGVICPKCGDFIFSRSGHDYHPCSCGTVFIDGGDVKNSALTYERIGFGGGYSLEDIKKESIDLNLSIADLLKELDFEYEIRILTKDIFEKIKKINEEGRRPDLEEVMSMMYPERADLLKELDFEYEIRILTKDIFEKIKKINEEGRRPDLEEVMSMMYPERLPMPEKLTAEYEIRILTKDIFEKIKKINEEGRRPDLEEVMSMMYPERLPMPEKLTAYDIKDYMERAYKISRVEGIDANIIYEAIGKNNFKFSPVLLNDMAEKLNLPFFTEYRKMIGIFIREQEKIYYNLPKGKNNFKFSPVLLNDMAEKLNLPFFTEYRKMIGIFIREQEKIYYNLPKEKVFSKIKVLGHKIYKIYPQKTIITIFLNDCLERRGIIKKDEMVEIF